MAFGLKRDTEKHQRPRVSSDSIGSKENNGLKTFFVLMFSTFVFHYRLCPSARAAMLLESFEINFRSIFITLTMPKQSSPIHLNNGSVHNQAYVPVYKVRIIYKLRFLIRRRNSSFLLYII